MYIFSVIVFNLYFVIKLSLYLRYLDKILKRFGGYILIKYKRKLHHNIKIYLILDIFIKNIFDKNIKINFNKMKKLLKIKNIVVIILI